jgi:archaellum biogenesis ATPase FlaH
VVKEELVRRSPLRILEKTIHGGLGKGNLGAIAAKRGVGKTAFLVHLATDQLFQGKHVIHVSFSASTAHIIDWYEEIFFELKKRHNLDAAPEIHDDIIKNRVIMNFHQQGLPIAKILNSLKAMIEEGHFDAEMIVVDGFDVAVASEKDILAFKNFAEQMSLEIWFSVTLPNPEAFESTVGRFSQFFAILIQLKPQKSYTHLELVKDQDQSSLRNLHLKLDPKTMLIAKED